MVYRKSFKNRSRKHRNSHRHMRNKNVLNKTLKRGYQKVKYTSKKYMPQVKSRIENVGSTVTNTATKSIPMLQKATRRLFSMFGKKKH